MATRSRTRAAAAAAPEGDEVTMEVAQQPSKTKKKPSKNSAELDQVLKAAKRQDTADAEAARVARANLRKSLVECVVRGGRQV